MTEQYTPTTEEVRELIAEARKKSEWYGETDLGPTVNELADALEATLGEPNDCLDHKLVQHRDGKPPWCNACGRAAVPDAATEELERAHNLINLREFEIDTLDERITELKAERDATVAAIERVRAIHQPMWIDDEQVCDSCYGEGYEEYRSWPCATFQALDGAPEPEVGGAQ